MKNKDYYNAFVQKLNYRRYSSNTVEIYAHYLNEFLNKTNKSACKLTADDFQSYLNNCKFSSASQQNQIISAIKFFYENILQKKYNKVDFVRPRKTQRLIQIPDIETITNTINNIENLKHKAIVSTAYDCALRVSEIINLKITDIDSKNMIIKINNAKGNKDRIVPLHKKLLLLLQQYYKEYRPKIYLFNGQKKEQYSSGSCNKIAHQYFGASFNFHKFRHASITHHLEQGTNIRLLQVFAGHKHVDTTAKYTHISPKYLQQIVHLV